MADKIKYELVSPEHLLASGEADLVTIPGSEGIFGAGAGHTPFLTTIRPGLLTVTNGSDVQEYFVSGGFAEVTGDSVAVLASETKKRADVTRDDLEARIAAAREELEEIDTDDHHSHHSARQRVNDLVAAFEHMF